MTGPVVSVVMASYNSACHIPEAIHSVLKQSLANLELIVVDDASSDASPEIVEHVSKTDNRVRLVRATRNSGPAAARNLGLEQARGQWIAIMDSDDLMHLERLNRLVTRGESDNADIVADDLLSFWDDGSSAPKLHLELSSPVAVNAVGLLGNANKYGYLKPVYRRERLGNIRYDENLSVGEDLDFLLRALVTGAAMRLYPTHDYFYRQRQRPPSASSRRRNLEGMLEASVAFRAKLVDERVSRACERREAEIHAILEYIEVQRLLREKRYFNAVETLLRHPKSIRGAGQTLLGKIARLKAEAASRWRRETGPSDLQTEVDRLKHALSGYLIQSAG